MLLLKIIVLFLIVGFLLDLRLISFIIVRMIKTMTHDIIIVSLKNNTTILNSVILYGNIIADNSTIKDEKIENKYIFNDTRVNYHTALIDLL